MSVRASEVVATSSLEGSPSVSTYSANNSKGTSLSRDSVFVPASSLLSNDSANARTHNSGPVSVSSWTDSSHSAFIPASKLLSFDSQSGRSTNVSRSGPLTSQVAPRSHGNLVVTLGQKDVLETSVAAVDSTSSCCPAGLPQSQRDYPAVRNNTDDEHFGSDKRTKVTQTMLSSTDYVQRPRRSDQKGSFPESEHGWCGRGDFGLTNSRFHAISELRPLDTKCMAGGPQPVLHIPDVVDVAQPDPRQLQKYVSLPDGDVRGKGGSKKRKVEAVANASAKITNFFER